MDDNKTEETNLDELYRECFTPVFRYLYLRTKDYDLASDLTQSSFLKFMRQKNNPMNAEHARKLLFVIAKSALIDNWRSAAGHRTYSLDEGPEVGDDGISQEEESIRKEDSDHVKLILSDLSEIENEVISMRLSSEIGYDAIGEALQISAVNARKIYSRAIKKVGTILKSSGRF